VLHRDERGAGRAGAFGLGEPDGRRLVVERLERLARARDELGREPLARGARRLVLGRERNELSELIARARAGRREQAVAGHRGREPGGGFRERIELDLFLRLAGRTRGGCCRAPPGALARTRALEPALALG